MRYFGLLLLLSLMFSACQANSSAPTPRLTAAVQEQVPTVDPADTRLADAQYQYNVYCAHCHGYLGEGQRGASVDLTRELGYHIVPPHDSTGHTWQHADQVLFDTIKYGIVSPLNLYPMAEYGSRLSNDQIWAVIDYMRGFWTAEQRTHQAELTERFRTNNPYWEENRPDPLNPTATP